MLYPNKRLKKLGYCQGFPVWDLAAPFRDYVVENKVCLHGFENTAMCVGHQNPDGHKLAGEIISKIMFGKSKVKNQKLKKWSAPQQSAVGVLL